MTLTAAITERELAHEPAKRAAITPFVHRFYNSLTNSEAEALAVLHGREPRPVSVYEGRLCFVTGSTRTRTRKGWGFYNVLHVHFLDGSIEMVPAAKFGKGAKPAPLGAP